MSYVLLDTTVASLFHPKKARDTRRDFYAQHILNHTMALSFQPVAELWDWAEQNQWSEKSRKDLETFLRRFLVIPYDILLAQSWARVMDACRRQGRRIECGDCWIAATAVRHGIPLLTHDNDFVGRTIPGLTVISALDSSGA